MDSKKLAYLQELFDRHHSNFLGVSLVHSQCTSFDVPDSASDSKDWLPVHRFERRTLYRRDGAGIVPATAWVCEGAIVRAWFDDNRNVLEVIGKPLDDFLGGDARLNVAKRKAS